MTRECAPPIIDVHTPMLVFRATQFVGPERAGGRFYADTP